MSYANISGTHSGLRRIGRALTVLATVLAVSMWARTARAGDVSGTIKFDSANALGSPPQRSRGFTNRLPNPIKPTRKFNPRPHMIVVLEPTGGAPDGDDGPRRTRYELLGESFALAVLAVQTGTEVEIKNSGPYPAALFSPSHADKLPAGAINPSATKAFIVDKAYEPVVIRAEGVGHVKGVVVGFPHPYFAQVDERGSFEIKGVPDGKYKVRVWYEDGWLVRSEETIDVGGRKTRVDPEVLSKLEVKPPGK